MPRPLDPSFAAALGSDFLVPFFAVEITFASQTWYLWSGNFPLQWNGQTWTALGDLGQVGAVAESATLHANGTSISLSGVNPADIQESLDDVQLGAACTIYLGAFNTQTGAPIGTPYPYFVGQVDQPTVDYNPDKPTIALAIESALIRLSQGTHRLYTSADQRIYNPTSTLFAWVESLNDSALSWGT